MRKIISTIATLAMSVSMFAIPQAVTLADSNSINFESYLLGTIDNQDGWSSDGAAGSGCATYDHEVDSSNGVTGFGSQSLRISNSVTSGCFGDQTFSKSLVNEAGESVATNNGMSGGTRQPHFEAQFSFASTLATYQAGMAMSVSPDRGDGSRMSYLKFQDDAAGMDVFFVDVSGTTSPVSFDEHQVANDLLRSVPHTAKFSIDYINGASNDVVKIYIDGALVYTGTSWENYYRYDNEASAEQTPRTTDDLIFRTGGTATPSNNGNGFLFDNLSLLSGPISPAGQSCTDITLVSNTNTHFKGLTTTSTPVGSDDALFTGGTAGNAVVADSDGFPGAWDTAESDPDVAGASWVNNSATPPTNPAGTGGDGTVNSWRLFSHSFTVPAGATVSSAVLHMAADNSAQAFLDNNSVGSALSYTTVDDFSLGSMAVGSHELEFVVKNDAYEGATNPTGVIYKAVVNYCVPTVVVIAPCPAAPAVAAAYLKSKGIKPGSAQSTNIISKVAQHMGPQTQFDTATPCEEAYATKVKAFVDTFLVP
jgi:hypothetical protein